MGVREGEGGREARGSERLKDECATTCGGAEYVLRGEAPSSVPGVLRLRC